MSLLFYLYKAPEGLPPINRWDKMHASSLGTAEQVKEKLSNLFPALQWKHSEKFWYGTGDKNEPYLDVLLTEEAPGNCFFIALNKAPPSVMRKIMEGLSLNYVSVPESDDLVDPYAYDDSDPLFAARDWDKNAR